MDGVIWSVGFSSPVSWVTWNCTVVSLFWLATYSHFPLGSDGEVPKISDRKIAARSPRRCPRQVEKRNGEFADSPLEGDGFEPMVPRHGEAALRSPGERSHLAEDAPTGDHDLATAGHAGNVSKERERSIAMADLVVIAFPTEAKAEEIRGKLLDMQKDYLIELSDAVIAVKQPNGGVKLNQLFHPASTGAVSGTFWGTLIGLIFLMPLAGAAIGAAAGALSGALTDVGINDQFMKDVSQSLQSGNAALFLLIRKVTADKVLAGLQGVAGTVLRTSLDHSKEEALQRALAGAVAAQPAAVPVSTPTTAG